MIRRRLQLFAFMHFKVKFCYDFLILCSVFVIIIFFVLIAGCLTAADALVLYNLINLLFGI